MLSLNEPDLVNLPKQTPNEQRLSREMEVAFRMMDSLEEIMS